MQGTASSAVGAVDEVEGSVEEFLIHRFHTLLVKRPGVFDSSACPTCRTADPRWSVHGRRRASAARRAGRTFIELGVLGIVGILRLFLGVEVVEVAEEFVEAMHGWQKFVAVAEMVLAKLAGRIAKRLKQLGERRILAAILP